MQLPGFTAEMSLGNSGERYEAQWNAAAAEGTQRVQPQICRRQGNTITCYECSDGICWTHTIHIPTLF